MKTKAASNRDHGYLAGSRNRNAVSEEPRFLPVPDRSGSRPASMEAGRHAADDFPAGAVEKPPSPGLVYSYVIDAEDARRAAVHRMIGGRSNMVARTYRDRSSFLAEADRLDAGCVILFDTGPEDRTPLTPFIRHLCHRKRFACILMVTGSDLRTAIEAMKAGATDCLQYPCAAEEMASSVDEALHLVREAVQGDAALIAARRQIDRLTAREQDVLHGLMRGKSNKMIALDLSISPRTVEIYRAHLMEKLGTRSLSETLKVAFAAGLG